MIASDGNSLKTAMNFAPMLTKLIMECNTEPALSVLINGKPCGVFNSNRGLRQGCLLCPYLFCMVMEFFSATLNACANNGLMPTLFTRGHNTISHLLFADDVKIFAAASIQVVSNIKRLLEDLKKFSGLNINCSKSRIFFSNCPEEMEYGIQSVLNF